MASNCLGQTEGRGHRNLERRSDGIGTVAVVSPGQGGLVATVLERTCDALRARPRPTHPRAATMGTTRTFTIQGYAARNRVLTLTERHDPAPASFLPTNEAGAES